MKIIHVVYSLEMGGAEVLVSQLCRVQRAAGHEVSVCAYASLGAVGQLLREEGFAIYVPGEAPPALTMLRYFRHFLRTKPDVVHCHNPAPTLQAALSARLAGIRAIVSTRHSLVAPPWDRAAERKYNLCAHACDWITGICDTTCNHLRAIPGAQKKKIVRVYNGVAALEPAQAPEEGERSFTLVFIGRLAAVKNLEMLLEAVAIARRRVAGLAFWIVGDGSRREVLEREALRLDLASTVRFWGQHVETAPFFSAADLFVMSSVSEGLPMSLLQAMSLGIPAVLTDVGGMAEVVRLAQCGKLVPVGDAAGMADAIVSLAQDPALRKQFSENARAAYRTHFTSEAMYQDYLKLYTSAR